MKDPDSKRLVMIGIRRKGEKKFKTRYESNELKVDRDNRKKNKTNPHPLYVEWYNALSGG